MRLRRLELAVIALTLAFACFMGGYFTGRRGAVNIVTLAPKNIETRIDAAATSPPGLETQPSSAAPAQGTLGTDVVAESAVPPDSNQGGAGDAAPAPAVSQAQEASGAPRGGDGKININLASQSELMDLPGIGSVIAARIVDYRRQNGGFSKIEDIQRVSGIGEKRYEAIKDMITVG